MKIAVLDDYQSVAESLADWSQLPPGAEVTFFSDHLVCGLMGCPETFHL
jgi:hypothetical protein